MKPDQLPEDFPANDLVLHADGTVDVEATLGRLRSTELVAEERADNDRHYANQLLGCNGGSYFEWEDARDESREWRFKAYRARQAAAWLQQQLSR
jgi:hypothetical protein